MKKATKLLSCMLAFCLIVSCGFVNASAAKKSDKTGKYYIYELSMDGMTLEYEGLKEYYNPEEMFIELKKDGTAVLSFDGDEEEFEWSDDSLTIDGEKVSYKIDGDLLSMELEDVEFTFVKEGSDTYKKLPSGESSASSKSESSKKESSKTESSETETSKTESSKDEKSDKKSDSKTDKKTDTKNLPDSDPSVHDEVTIEKTELFNEGGVVVTVNKLKYDDDKSYGKYELSYTIKNDSDKTVNVSTSLFSINGLMYDYGYIYGTVDAGKKLNDSCNIYFSDLEDFDIGTIANIDIKVKVYDYDSYDDIGKSETVSIKTSADGTFNQKYDDSGVVVYDANDVKIICKKVVEDKYYDAGVIKFYIENNSDKNISISSSYNKTYINDTAADITFYPTVAAGCKMYYDAPIYTSAEDLDIKDYNDIKTLDMEISLSDIDSDSYDYLDTEEITVNLGE